ncbi:MAG: TAXI family TRAP transporter solute-binding subunit [Synergistetes bacterium]|nr:TAXI family TRAP transporter solute-binding subunit [Synergistota bacterium]MCX8127891.1 TAXI family TRAP transporter solute-binding subunit [Synergistota bacterium]MDW8192153.1 TAXI family TRAP transporter solute-binding subunit [Synergistota bacterium]
MGGKRLAGILMVLALIISFSLGKAVAASGSKKYISIGTASVGGAYFSLGQSIANIVNKYVKDVEMVAEVTGGSVENPRLVSQGDVEFGLTNANLAYFGVMGMPPYKDKLKISAVASLHPSVFHIITLGNSPINAVSDFKGKRIAVGPAGGGTIPVLEVVLEEYGLSIKDILPSYLSYSDGFMNLADGNVDIALALSGYPASAVLELTANKRIKFINIEDDKMANIMKKHPYYSKIVVPKDVYKLEKDAVAIGIRNVLIVRSDVDEILVYQITKAIFDNLEELRNMNAIAKQIDLEEASKVPIPLHPGAKRYFDERSRK